MKAKTIKGKSPEEIQSALTESLADGFKPTLAIIFLSVTKNRKAICEIFNIKGINILGATSCGLFTNGYHAGYEGESSTVVLLLDIH